MSTWGEQLEELRSVWTSEDGTVDLDGMRRSYVVALHEYTKRNVVVYYSGWMQTSAGDVSIVLNDIHGLMEVFKDLKPENGLDLILHSPGGDPTAADSLVRYMRSKFDDVRVIVPVAAMSAATMWALSADRILMGRQSQLGPIDPQIVNANGATAAGAITRTFERAQEECAQDPSRLSAWVPTLQQYYPGLLEICEDSTNLARTLAENYLRDNMFRDRDSGADLARVAAEFFANDQIHIAHGRGIGRAQVREYGLVVEDLEDDGELQDRVLSLHHAYMHTLSIANATKLIENHLGRLVVRMTPPPVAFVPGGTIPFSQP